MRLGWDVTHYQIVGLGLPKFFGDNFNIFDLFVVLVSQVGQLDPPTLGIMMFFASYIRPFCPYYCPPCKFASCHICKPRMGAHAC